MPSILATQLGGFLDIGDRHVVDPADSLLGLHCAGEPTVLAHRLNCLGHSIVHRVGTNFLGLGRGSRLPRDQSRLMFTQRLALSVADG